MEYVYCYCMKPTRSAKFPRVLIGALKVTQIYGKCRWNFKLQRNAAAGDYGSSAHTICTRSNMNEVCHVQIMLEEKYSGGMMSSKWTIW